MGVGVGEEKKRGCEAIYGSSCGFLKPPRYSFHRGEEKFEREVGLDTSEQYFRSSSIDFSSSIVFSKIAKLRFQYGESECGNETSEPKKKKGEVVFTFHMPRATHTRGPRPRITFIIFPRQRERRL